MNKSLARVFVFIISLTLSKQVLASNLHFQQCNSNDPGQFWNIDAVDGRKVVLYSYGKDRCLNDLLSWERCSGGDHYQHWHVDRVFNDLHVFFSVVKGKCLNHNLGWSTCDGSDINQLWKLQSVNGGRSKLIIRNQSVCLRNG